MSASKSRPISRKDTEGTIDEAQRLWREVGRKNLMIKVPGTQAGLPAIRELIADGINVNITLLFSQQVYEQVVEAYLSGLEALAAKGGDISQIASVASFFVSRIDTAVDKLLDEKIAQANDPDEKARLNALKGKVAIANAKLAYQRYKRLFDGARWQALAAKGAKTQRLLWARTGTKNKAYSDVLYVEELIGPDTVNTMPLATMDAFRDHGKLADTLEDNVADAQRVLGDLGRAGISLDAVTDKLVEDGVRLFADAADKLFGAVAREARQDARRQDRHADAGARRRADQEGRCRRRKSGAATAMCASFGSATNRCGPAPTRIDWLGWLDVVERRARSQSYQAFAEEIRREGFADALLLGMGGSSLGPEVLGDDVRPQARLSALAHSRLHRCRRRSRRSKRTLDLGKTLFIVSSKSGSTTRAEHLQGLFLQARRRRGRRGEGRRGTSSPSPIPARRCEQAAKAQDFRQIFFGVPSIGGRYSVLSPFGLVPAAVAGIDVAALLDKSARVMMRSCGPDVPPSQNPGVALGLALGAAAQAGRDKVTILASPRIADFGAWLEQLLAESTGKNGKGLIPVDDEPLGVAAGLRRRSLLHRSCARRRRATPGTTAGSTRCERPAIRWCASSWNRPNISARNSSASRSRPRSPARSSASIRSISPTSRPARSRPAS